ncbi:MAG TPA: ATP-binding cassette domain-containing protein [Dehalococcoidia bacterium]|jgi:manganese/zinc/iron transport system ATP- binding protein|nr:ATP-binding cassette domain-containing protein [Dehalococcoidia bacterium]
MPSITGQPLENIVECENLTVIRDSKEILCDASCCVPRHSLTFLVGENGSGKTTLVKTILGLLPKLAGEISINSEILTNSRAVVGYVPQSVDFPKQLQMTVTEYLKYTANIIPEEVEDTLARVDFPFTHAGRPITQLSGGQQQKLLLAAELARDPELLFLDEPLSNVDHSGEKHILDVILEIKNSGVTIVIITHDWQMVSSYADHVICLNKNFICDQPNSCICKNSISKVKIRQIQKLTPDPTDTHDGYCYVDNI